MAAAHAPARSGQLLPAVAAEPGPYVEGGDAQESGRPRPSAFPRVALGAAAHVGKWLLQKVVSSSLLSRACRG